MFGSSVDNNELKCKIIYVWKYFVKVDLTRNVRLKSMPEGIITSCKINYKHKIKGLFVSDNPLKKITFLGLAFPKIYFLKNNKEVTHELV